MLVELIAKNAGQEQEKHRYYPSPSKVGQCVRALTYHAIGVESDPFPDRALMVFSDGNWHEELIKDHIRKTVFELTEWKGKDQRIKIAEIDGKMMDGEIDGLITDPQGTIRIFDAKSINHFGFERLKDEPDENNRRQLNLYLHGVQIAGFTEIKEGLLIYKNKNTSALKEFIIQYDKEQAEKDIEMFRQVARWAKDRVVPPRPYDRDVDWQCGYCRFASTCYANYEKEFEMLTKDVALGEETETLFKFYLETYGHMKEFEKEEEKLKNKIRKLLKDRDVSGGHIGPYVAKLTFVKKTSIDKELIPAEILKEVQKTTEYEKLTIRKVEEKNEKVHNHKT